MPRKVTAWACSYKCGYKVQTSRTRMVAHEVICFHNPAMRACQTCGNYSCELDSASDDRGEFFFGGMCCEVEKFVNGEDRTFDCRHWKAKAETA